MNTSISTFRNQYLDGTVPEITSQPIPMQGNRLVMALTVINISGASAGFNFRAQGSYDGLAWINLGVGKDVAAFGYDSEAVASVDVSFVRVRVKSTAGTSPKAIFDVSLAMSQQ